MDFMDKLCVGNNKCWLFDDNTRTLYSIDLNTSEMKVEIMLNLYRRPYYDAYFSDLVYCDEKVILVPGREDRIYIYDTKVKKSSYIEIEKAYREKSFKSIYAFINGIVMGRYLYLIPYTYSNCIKLNLDDMSIDYIPFENYFQCTIGMYSRGVKVNDREIALLSRENNGIEFYDVVENKFERFRVGDEDTYYKDLCFDGSQYWLTDYKGNLLRWNRTNKFIKKIFNYQENKIPTMGNHEPINERSIHMCDKFIWLFDYDYFPVRVNLEDGDWEIINDLVFQSGDIERYNIVFSCKKERCFVLCAKCINSIVIFDYKSNDIKLISLNSTKRIEYEVLGKFIDFVCKT